MIYIQLTGFKNFYLTSVIIFNNKHHLFAHIYIVLYIPIQYQ